MAKVQSRRRSDGGTSYRVMWVLGGGRPVPGAAPGTPGSQASETFTDEKLMRAFKAAVEAQDHRWPMGWVKGRGWVAAADDTVTPPTLDDVHDAWLVAEREKVLLNRKTAASLGKDKRIYELHIGPFFGSQPVDTITRPEIRGWVAGLTQAGASAKSVRNWHAVFSATLRYAMTEMGARTDNPCSGTPLPRETYDRDIAFFQHGEWAVLRRCLRSDVHLLVDTALATGLRWGELTALQVGDLTVVPGGAGDTVLTIHVQRAWTERNIEFDHSPVDTAAGETATHKLGPTKSRKDRWVQVAGPLAEHLLESVAGKTQHAYVFTTARGNPWRYDDFHSDRWAPAVRLAAEHGLTKTARFHMLRHTFTVWLLAAGESIHVISTRLGHASIQITMDRYGGLLDLHDAGTARRMADQLASAESAILPFHLRQEDVDVRPVRPGARNERRRRTG